VDLTTVTSHRPARGRGDLALAPGESLLAGGTWLFSEPQPTTTGLVDLTTLGWPDTEPLPDGGLRLAATCPVAVLRDLGPEPCRQAAEALLMSWKVAAVATVGGNLCLALPAGAVTSLTAGLGAEAVVWTPDGGERREPVDRFVRGVRRTSLAPGEVLRAVDLPAGWDAAGATWFGRVSLTDHGRSGAVVVAHRSPSGALRVVVTAATTRPVLVDPADPTASLAAVDCWYDDVHGAPDWRAAVTADLVAQALAALGGAP